MDSSGETLLVLPVHAERLPAGTKEGARFLLKNTCRGLHGPCFIFPGGEMKAIEIFIHLYLWVIKLLVLAIMLPMYLAIALLEAVCYDLGR